MLIDKLKKEQALTKEDWVELIEGRNAELAEYLFALAREERHHYYDHDVYVRGLDRIYQLLQKRLSLLRYTKE